MTLGPKDEPAEGMPELLAGAIGTVRKTARTHRQIDEVEIRIDCHLSSEDDTPNRRTDPLVFHQVDVGMIHKRAYTTRDIRNDKEE